MTGVGGGGALRGTRAADDASAGRGVIEPEVDDVTAAKLLTCVAETSGSIKFEDICLYLLILNILLNSMPESHW
jgi:hypothetical protein